MNLELIVGLILFALASSLTPGPNNLMLMTSGVNFGFKLTMPHMLGVSLGFAFMAMLVGVGIIQLFDAYPVSYQILKVLSVSYMLFLAYKIANSSDGIRGKKSGAKPFSFIQAVLFQWVNPKAWSMALTAVTVYTPNQSVQAVVFVALLFSVVNFPCIACWTTLGTKISRWLHTPKRLRIFNMTMALLLVLSLYPIFL